MLIKLDKKSRELKECLLMVDCHVSDEFVSDLNEEQKEKAMKWANLTYMDYTGAEVKVPEKPDFLPEQTYE